MSIDPQEVTIDIGTFAVGSRPRSPGWSNCIGTTGEGASAPHAVGWARNSSYVCGTAAVAAGVVVSAAVVVDAAVVVVSAASSLFPHALRINAESAATRMRVPVVRFTSGRC